MPAFRTASPGVAVRMGATYNADKLVKTLSWNQ